VTVGCYRTKNAYYDDVFVYGNAVIWGSDKEGNLDNVKTSLSEIFSKIKWVDELEASLIRDKVMNTPPTIKFWDM
jgi:hypothetical protein